MKRLIFVLVCIINCCVSLAQQSSLYALLISGGRNKLYNHERYLNDCAFLYRTLRSDYLIAKDHITLLMADGNNPASDMLLDGGTGFASSPTDLDGDGEDDLYLAATMENLQQSLNRLTETLTPKDHLFVFITDHGERTTTGVTRLWLWDGHTVTPSQLADLFRPLHPASICFLMGQCFAGALADELLAEHRIIITSCGADELSWSSPGRPYDEFVYHWTCAIAGHDENYQPIEADENHDGHITLDEAFAYAYHHDRRPETPAISSLPATLASQWSFDKHNLPAAIYCPTSFPPSHRIFNLLGQDLDAPPSKGIYIEDGHKKHKKR
jgi:hypothetical protein